MIAWPFLLLAFLVKSCFLLFHHDHLLLLLTKKKKKKKKLMRKHPLHLLLLLLLLPCFSFVIVVPACLEASLYEKFPLLVLVLVQLQLQAPFLFSRAQWAKYVRTATESESRQVQGNG